MQHTKLVIFSDSHGNFSRLHTVMERQAESDVFFHLGDGEREWDDIGSLYPNRPSYFVRGNGDFGSPSPAEQAIVIDGKKIFFTHGYLYQVKSGLSALKKQAKLYHADIVLFGHTHQPLAEWDNGILYVNPGSIRGIGGSPSYATVIIQNGQMVPNIARL